MTAFDDEFNVEWTARLFAPEDLEPGEVRFVHKRELMDSLEIDPNDPQQATLFHGRMSRVKRYCVNAHGVDVCPVPVSSTAGKNGTGWWVALPTVEIRATNQIKRLKSWITEINNELGRINSTNPQLHQQVKTTFDGMLLVLRAVMMQAQEQMVTEYIMDPLLLRKLRKCYREGEWIVDIDPTALEEENGELEAA